MNGTPSTDSPDGVQPGNAGDALDSADGRGEYSARITAIALAQLTLETEAGGDVDLAKAAEKVAQWLAREAGRPKGE